MTKSKKRQASCRFEIGSGLKAWIMSGNLIASRMKKTLRLLPTRSQLPSTVLNLIAKPRGSRAVSGDSLAPATVEKRMKTGVLTPFCVSTLARVYREAGSPPMVP
jgi:hypothetical protein